MLSVGDQRTGGGYGRSGHGKAWQLYDDMFRHRADGPHALAKDDRRSVARWVLFLRTDIEYSWPNYDFRQSGTSVDRF